MSEAQGTTESEVDERAFATARSLQAQRHESLGRLAAGVAHDFNNILQAILGNAGLAQLDACDSEHGAFLEKIDAAARRGAELCRQLMACAGNGRGVEVTDVGALVTEVCGLLRAALKRTIELRCELGNGLPRVKADRALLRHLLVSLVQSAADATGETGVIEIRLAVRQCAEIDFPDTLPSSKRPAGEYLELQIGDGGCGMDEPVDPAVLDIVRAHRGAFEVETVPGVGTTRRLLLPT